MAGPVTGLGQNQAVYIEVSGFPVGSIAAVAFCSISSGSLPVPVVAQPTCASAIPPPGDCRTQNGSDCPNTPSPLEWQYATVQGAQSLLSIGTEFDPRGLGQNPIISQTASQFDQGVFGSFNCDDGPDFCGVEIVDIPVQDAVAAIGDGYPPRSGFPLSENNALILPLNWSSTASGCSSAPLLQADTSFSAQQILPAAAEATCTGPGGVAVLPTAIASTDDAGCSSGTGSSCPIADVANGVVPVTFTDDPEDPATLSEEKKLGGKFAYIPIAVSATEIAFAGAAGANVSGVPYVFPISDYRLTPAMTAGVMTQLWSGVGAQLFAPNDDLCGQLPSGGAPCIEGARQASVQVLAATSSGNKLLTLTQYSYPRTDTFYQSGPRLTQSDYEGQTAFALLNPWLGYLGHFPVNETSLSAAFPSTASGASFEATEWMCAAPSTRFPVSLPWAPSTKVHVGDIMSAAQILADAELGPIQVNGAAGHQVQNSFVSQDFLFKPSRCQALSNLPTDFAPPSATVAHLYLPSSSPLTASHAIQGAAASYGGNGGVALGAMDSSQADFYGLFPASLQNAAGQFVGPSQASIQAAVADATTNADGTLSPNFTKSDPAAYPMPLVTYALVATSAQSGYQAQQLHDLLTNIVNYSHAGGVGYSVPMPAGYVPLPDKLYQQALGDISHDINGSSASGSSNGGGSKAGSAGSGTSGSGKSRTGKAGSSGKPGGSGASNGGTASGLGRALASPLLLVLGAERFLLPLLIGLAGVSTLGGALLYVSPEVRRRLAGIRLPGWFRGSQPRAGG